MQTIEVRDYHFDLAAVPRDWHPGGTAVTAFFDNLSIFFPPGERFFIASVKANRHHVTDPELLDQIKAFCAQEGLHSREHVAYNQMLDDGGVPAAAMEERVARLIRRRSKKAGARRNLAATAALEHFTAILADMLLSDPSILEGADENMAALWRWHAAEENEHKAVAFDVYKAAGGNYVERCVAMLIVTVVFWAKVFEHQVRVMKARDVLFSPRQWWSFARHALIKPAWMPRLIIPYLRYFKPSFHPWDHDNRQLLEEWKARAA